MTTDYDVFISHASEDKQNVALPLARHLQTRGLKVWIDELELSLGDSLRRKIDQGLSQSKFGVVILSPAFFSKEWPNKELDALVAREDGRDKVILPVWHNIGAGEIIKYSPLLADKLAVSTQKGLDFAAEKIVLSVFNSNNSGLSEKHIGPPEEVILQRLGRQMLTAGSSWELRKTLYELEEYMALYPHSPEAKILMDRITEGMERAERMENITRLLAEKLAFRKILDYSEQTIRLSNILRPDADLDEDWYRACTLLGLIAFENPVPLLFPIKGNWYPAFERVWLKEIKETKAFFIWESDKSRKKYENYNEACENVRDLFFNAECLEATTFAPVEKYLIDSYLEKDGKGGYVVDETKAHGLIKRKAERIYLTSGNTNSVENWVRAKFYVNLFYNNTIPSVQNINNEINVAAVLRAIQFSESPHTSYLIVNVLEAGIAVYFLNKDVLQKLAHDINTVNISIAPITTWKSSFADDVNVTLRFDEKQNQLVLYGTMTEEEKVILAAKVETQEQRTAVELLYEQSFLALSENLL